MHQYPHYWGKLDGPSPPKSSLDGGMFPCLAIPRRLLWLLSDVCFLAYMTGCRTQDCGSKGVGTLDEGRDTSKAVLLHIVPGECVNIRQCKSTIYLIPERKLWQYGTKSGSRHGMVEGKSPY